jgi:hypothetical protein
VTIAGEAHTFVAESTDETVLFRADALAEGEPVIGGWARVGDETQGTVSISGNLQTAPVLASSIELEINPELSTAGSRTA